MLGLSYIWEICRRKPEETNNRTGSDKLFLGLMISFDGWWVIFLFFHQFLFGNKPMVTILCNNLITVFWEWHFQAVFQDFFLTVVKEVFLLVSVCLLPPPCPFTLPTLETLNINKYKIAIIYEWEKKLLFPGKGRAQQVVSLQLAITNLQNSYWRWKTPFCVTNQLIHITFSGCFLIK